MPRLTFKKKERLSSRKAITELYEKGKSFHAGNFKVIYLLKNEAGFFPCQVVFSAPKKMFKRAVDRNMIKRRMREAYRMNKPAFYEQLNKDKTLHVLFLYSDKKVLSFEEISKGMAQSLAGLVKKGSE